MRLCKNKRKLVCFQMTDAEKLKNEFNFSLLNKNAHEIKKLKVLFEDFKSELFGSVYPIGSIYMSTSAVSPESLFGGKWEQIKGRFLLGADDTHALGSIGGELSHTHGTSGHALTLNEMPAHQGHLYSNGDAVWPSASEDTYYMAISSVNKYGSRPYVCRAGNEAVPRGFTRGSGSAHSHGNTHSASNLPPYLAVYVWKRTA